MLFFNYVEGYIEEHIALLKKLTFQYVARLEM